MSPNKTLIIFVLFIIRYALAKEICRIYELKGEEFTWRIKNSRLDLDKFTGNVDLYKTKCSYVVKSDDFKSFIITVKTGLKISSDLKHMGLFLANDRRSSVNRCYLDIYDNHRDKIISDLVTSVLKNKVYAASTKDTYLVRIHHSRIMCLNRATVTLSGKAYDCREYDHDIHKTKQPRIIVKQFKSSQGDKLTEHVLESISLLYSCVFEKSIVK